MRYPIRHLVEWIAHHTSERSPPVRQGSHARRHHHRSAPRSALGLPTRQPMQRRSLPTQPAPDIRLRRCMNRAVITPHPLHTGRSEIHHQGVRAVLRANASNRPFPAPPRQRRRHVAYPNRRCRRQIQNVLLELAKRRRNRIRMRERLLPVNPFRILRSRRLHAHHRAQQQHTREPPAQPLISIHHLAPSLTPQTDSPSC